MKPFQELMKESTREERFRATVYAMNTILIGKEIYSLKEFEYHFHSKIEREISNRPRIIAVRKRKI